MSQRTHDRHQPADMAVANVVGGLPADRAADSGRALSREQLLTAIAQLRRHTAVTSERFQQEHGDQVEEYRQQISQGLQEALQRWREQVAELSGNNPTCLELVDQAADYVDWLQWTFWDLPHFAVAVKPEVEKFRWAVCSSGLVYLGIRVLDDLVDRHFWYRGRRLTLFSTVQRSGLGSPATEGITFLGSLLLCFEGLNRLTAASEDSPLDPATASLTLERLCAAARRVLIGMTMEQSGREDWSADYYERMIVLKNVDYWRTLYSALDPGHTSALYPFLVEYYNLAQKLNDAQDHSRDEAIDQPNLVSISRRDPGAQGRGGNETAPVADAQGEDRDDQARSTTHWPLQVERTLAEDFLRLARLASELPELESSIALLKLGESLQEAEQIGLFHAPAQVATAVTAPADSASTSSDRSSDHKIELAQPTIARNSEQSALLQRLGPDALEETGCPVCASWQERTVLRHQGFRLARCKQCRHLYVNPRLRPELQNRVVRRWQDSSSLFDDAQEAHAAVLCQMLREHATGPRFLQVGIGTGQLLRTAAAFGFDSYGLDCDARSVARLAPLLGRRLLHLDLDQTAPPAEEGVEPQDRSTSGLPWGDFDVVVLHHVLEHQGQPGRLLERVQQAMRPGALLYVAVPDSDSLQMRLLGKRWQSVRPLVHLQYFNLDSLAHLLQGQDFEVLRRVRPPALGSAFPLPAWTHLMRQLGGDELGELAVLARLGEKTRRRSNGDWNAVQNGNEASAPRTEEQTAGEEGTEGDQGDDPT